MDILPQSHRQAFVSILLDRLGMETLRAREVADRLSPLFDIAEDDDGYPLSSVDRFNPAALASQMRELTGRVDIERVAVHSLSVLRQDRTTLLISPLYAIASHTTPLATGPRGLPANAGAILVEAVRQHILAGCRTALECSFRAGHKSWGLVPNLNSAIIDIAIQNIEHLALNYCAAAIVDDRALMNTLDMTVAFLGSIIPLGVSTRDPSTATFLYLGA